MRVYINKCWSCFTCRLFKDTLVVGPLELMANDSPKLTNVVINIQNTTKNNNFIVSRKILHIPFNPAFFMLSTRKSIEILPKYNEYDNSEYFVVK